MNRRDFLTTSVAGILPNWLLKEEKPPLDDRFNYDVSAFAHTDPALLRYNETGHVPTGFREPKCLAVTGNNILVGGDRAIKRDLSEKLEWLHLQPNVFGIGANLNQILKDLIGFLKREPRE